MYCITCHIPHHQDGTCQNLDLAKCIYIFIYICAFSGKRVKLFLMGAKELVSVNEITISFVLCEYSPYSTMNMPWMQTRCLHNLPSFFLLPPVPSQSDVGLSLTFQQSSPVTSRLPPSPLSPGGYPSFTATTAVSLTLVRYATLLVTRARAKSAGRQPARSLVRAKVWLG